MINLKHNLSIFGLIRMQAKVDLEEVVQNILQKQHQKGFEVPVKNKFKVYFKFHMAADDLREGKHSCGHSSIY